MYNSWPFVLNKTDRLSCQRERRFFISIHFQTKSKTKSYEEVFVLAAVAMMIAGCSSDDALNEEQTVETSTTEQVTVTFAPYTQEAMTRASQTAIGSVVTRLDVWVVEGDSATALTKTAVSEAHQQKGDTGFGSLTLSLDKHKTYTLYAVGHKVSQPATFSQGIITLPDTKKLQTLYYQTLQAKAQAKFLIKFLN